MVVAFPEAGTSAGACQQRTGCRVCERAEGVVPCAGASADTTPAGCDCESCGILSEIHNGNDNDDHKNDDNKNSDNDACAGIRGCASVPREPCQFLSEIQEGSNAESTNSDNQRNRRNCHERCNDDSNNNNVRIGGRASVAGWDRRTATEHPGQTCTIPDPQDPGLRRSSRRVGAHVESYLFTRARRGRFAPHHFG